MSTINHRLKTFLKDQKIPQNVLADESGITRQAVNQYISNKIQMSPKTQLAICEAYQGLNANWFLFGRGEMYFDHENAEINEKIQKSESDHLTQLLDERQKRIDLLQQRISDLERTIKMLEGVSDE